MRELPEDALYFHAYWNRDPKTKLGVNYELLPRVKGKGRYLGTHIGVIGDPVYKGTWFGEGEVKIYLDGDQEYPTLCGTGTEDYIGSGWGQGTFNHLFQGPLISDNDHCLYSFYRYHLKDSVYFHQDCKVTIQQIGNSVRGKIREMKKNGVNVPVLWSYVPSDGLNAAKRYLDMKNPPRVEDDNFPPANSPIGIGAMMFLQRPIFIWIVRLQNFLRFRLLKSGIRTCMSGSTSTISKRGTALL